MNRKQSSMIFVLCLLLFRHNGWGQSVEPVVPTDLELKEAAEEEAGQVWKKDDRDIERQVFRESLADFIKRRDRAAQARRRYDANRLAKADAQVKEASKEVTTLEQFMASGIGAQNDEMEKTVGRQLERLTDREMKIRQSLGKQEIGRA